MALPGSVPAWGLWYLVAAAVGFVVVLLWSGDPSQYIHHDSLAVQRIVIATYLLLPLAAMLIFRFVFVAPYRLFIEQAQSGARGKFPQSNIVRTREDSYCILLAVAGFSRDEITITEHEHVLFVTGQKVEDEAQSANGEYPRGPFGHPFERRFNLAPNVEVRGASLENGLLRIDVHEQLEPKKPRKIDIRPHRFASPSQPTRIVERPKVA